MTTAAKVAEQKRKHPELYCPLKNCLWHTGGGYCPRHAPPQDRARTLDALAEQAVAALRRRDG